MTVSGWKCEHGDNDNDDDDDVDDDDDEDEDEDNEDKDEDKDELGQDIKLVLYLTVYLADRL